MHNQTAEESADERPEKDNGAVYSSERHVGGNNDEGRRSVPRLREILRRQRRDSDTGPDAPVLDFQYNDTDSLQEELAELYSYTEENDFKLNAEAFYAQYKKFETQKWRDLSTSRKQEYVQILLDRLEVVDLQERRAAARSLLYLLQGLYREFEACEDCLAMMRDNAILLYNCSVFSSISQLLVMESENVESVSAALQKASISIVDSIDLRIYLNILYMITEVLRNFACASEEAAVACESLKDELVGSINVDQNPPFACLLFDMVLKFCAGSSPHFPIKKILLLLWKVVLLTLGGFKDLKDKMKEARIKAGLAPCFGDDHANTLELERHYELRPASPAEEAIQLGKPKKKVDLDDDDIEFVPAPITHSQHYFENVLLLRPKVREKDVTAFLQTCRSKFVGFRLDNDTSSTAGLPPSIVEGLKVLKSHVYTSLAECQIKVEEEHIERPFLKGKYDLPVTEAEILYKALLPNLPQYMIALLKILLVSAPTAKAKTESINIMTDVLPAEMPATVLQSMQLGIDVNRHKEIMVKAISVLLLLLLKHFKVNHIYQFEFISQHLVFANCIPLVLKFYNQNISAYVSAKNSIPQLDFPTCVLEEHHEITAEHLEQTGGGGDFCWRNVFSCVNLLRILQKLTKWKYSRTMMLVVFKSAPILKKALKVREESFQLYVLKLLKAQLKYLGRNWRKSNMRVMSLIYHKIRHRLNDDWAFGNDVEARPWDFQTEECAIRHNVDLFNYHHYESGSSHHPADMKPVDNDFHSVMSQRVQLGDKFKQEYEKWLEREVHRTQINWNELLLNVDGGQV